MQKRGFSRLSGAALGLALTGVLAVGLSGALAAKKSKLVTQTVSSGDIALSIPDSGVEDVEQTTRVPLNVSGIPNKAKLTDVDVGLRISDTAGIGSMRDLDIHLATPRGVIRLSSDNGGVADDFGSGATSCAGQLLVLDSQATLPITGQNPISNDPVTGAFSPEEPLQLVNGLKGLKAKGPWTLLLSDDDEQAAHTIHCFNLVIKYQTPKKKKKK